MFHLYRFTVSAPVLLALLCGTSLSAQQGPYDLRREYPTCASADLETSLRFGVEINGNERIIIDRKNVSDHVCDLPPFDLNLGLSQEFYREPPGTPVVALPGQTGEEIVRWSTVPASDKSKCVKIGWMSEPILAVTPSLMPQVCSEVSTSLWTLIKSPFDSSTDATASVGSDREPEEPAFRLTAGKSIYDDGESFVLHVTRDPSSEWVPPEDNLCPMLFLSVNSPGRGERVDELHPISFQGCGPDLGVRSTHNWQTGFDLSSGSGSRWSGAGEHSFQVLAVSGSPDAAEVHFAASNVLRIQILDPTTIPRNWGPLTQGLRASVALDKETYRLGEDIPLHIAIQNLSSTLHVYSVSPVWDPFWAVGIEVLDSRGQPLPVTERMAPTGLMTGHGLGLRPFDKGKLVPLEWSLGRLGWLPKAPGEYTILASWCPCITDYAVTPYTKIDPKSCVTVRATATIRILNADQGSN